MVSSIALSIGLAACNQEEHTLNHVAAVDATCTQRGNIEYWECSDCGKIFGDQDGKNEIEESSVVIAKLSHTYDDGVCAVCGAAAPTEGLEYSVKSTYAVVKGLGTATDTDIVIADEYEGLPVTEIDYYAFYNCSRLTSVTIPDGITSIGNLAFFLCNSLESINIPERESISDVHPTSSYIILGTNSSINPQLQNHKNTEQKNFYKNA